MVMTVSRTTTISLLLLMMAGTSQSFTPAVHHYHNHHYYCDYYRHGQDEKHSTTTTALGVTVRPDASQAIQHALQVTKEFGPHSPQARLAWETVEELDSSTTPPPPATSATEKESSTTMVQQEDYKVAIQSLSRLLHDSQETLSQIETLAKMLQQMELENPNLVMTTTTTNTITNPKVQLVLQEAKAAAELYGFGSDQATQAWQVVESCLDSVNGNTEQADECNVESMYRYNAAALKAHHYYNAIVDTEFLQSSIQACEVLQQLRLYVKVESNRIN